MKNFYILGREYTQSELHEALSIGDLIEMTGDDNDYHEVIEHMNLHDLKNVMRHLLIGKTFFNALIHIGLVEERDFRFFTKELNWVDSIYDDSYQE